MPVKITWPGAGGPGVNTWHLRTTGDELPEGEELPGLSGLVHQFYTDLRPIFTEQTTITFEGTMSLTTDPGTTTNDADPWVVTGQASLSKLLPAAAQIVAGWQTELSSRSGKGRTFLGPLGSQILDNASDGTPSQSTVNLINDAGAALVSASSGFADGAVGVWSPTDNVFRDFTGIRTRKVFAVLTSRRD